MPNTNPDATALQRLGYDEANDQLYNVPVLFSDGTRATADLSGQLNEFAEVRVFVHGARLSTSIAWKRIEEMLETHGAIAL